MLEYSSTTQEVDSMDINAFKMKKLFKFITSQTIKDKSNS